MIIYDLTCEHNHQFEGWFSSISDFEKQQTDKFITCPICGNAHIRILSEASDTDTTSNADAAQELAAISSEKPTSQEIFSQLIEYVIKHSDDTDDSITEEIHKINGQEYQIRYIRDAASLEEMRDLIEEGAEVIPLTFKLPGKLH